MFVNNHAWDENLEIIFWCTKCWWWNLSFIVSNVVREGNSCSKVMKPCFNSCYSIYLESLTCFIWMFWNSINGINKCIKLAHTLCGFLGYLFRGVPFWNVGGTCSKCASGWFKHRMSDLSSSPWPPRCYP